MKRNLLTVLFILIALGFGVAGYLILPETVITQLSFSGNASATMPKTAAVLIPFAISLLSSLMYRFGEEKSRAKFVALTLIGYLIPLFTMFVNV